MIKEIAVIYMARPKKYSISLTDEQLKELKSIIRKKQTSKTVLSRCQIIIDLDEAHGKTFTHEQSTKSNGVCMATITNTVKLYHNEGIKGIITLKRNVNSDNARRKLEGRVEARLIEIACSPAPQGHSQGGRYASLRNRQKLCWTHLLVKMP